MITCGSVVQVYLHLHHKLHEILSFNGPMSKARVPQLKKRKKSTCTITNILTVTWLGLCQCHPSTCQWKNADPELAISVMLYQDFFCPVRLPPALLLPTSQPLFAMGQYAKISTSRQDDQLATHWKSEGLYCWTTLCDLAQTSLKMWPYLHILFFILDKAIQRNPDATWLAVQWHPDDRQNKHMWH